MVLDATTAAAAATTTTVVIKLPQTAPIDSGPIAGANMANKSGENFLGQMIHFPSCNKWPTRRLIELEAEPEPGAGKQ